jgi:hypothetical protein
MASSVLQNMRAGLLCVCWVARMTTMFSTRLLTSESVAPDSRRKAFYMILTRSGRLSSPGFNPKAVGVKACAILLRSPDLDGVHAAFPCRKSEHDRLTIYKLSCRHIRLLSSKWSHLSITFSQAYFSKRQCDLPHGCEFPSLVKKHSETVLRTRPVCIKRQNDK